MFLTNHTLTGVLLGVNVQNPWALAPVALASHFALDALPHFGHSEMDLDHITPKLKLIIAVDAALSLITLIVALVAFPDHRVAVLLGSFFATLPDLLYIPRHFYGWVPNKLYARFHKGIQWAEVSWGYAPELLYAALIISRLAK